MSDKDKLERLERKIKAGERISDSDLTKDLRLTSEVLACHPAEYAYKYQKLERDLKHLEDMCDKAHNLIDALVESGDLSANSERLYNEWVKS